ncbi:MAG: methyltransferase domain-containing protein [Thermoproteus sp.]
MSFIDSFFDEINALRHYDKFIKAGGGVGEVKKAVSWSTWYAVKWWDELRHELGLDADKSLFGKALFMSLRARGIIDDDGKIVKRVERPERPTNAYAAEFVELHDSFDALGATSVAKGAVDLEKLRLLYSAMLAQGWYNVMRDTFLDVVEVERYSKIIEPHCKEGLMAYSVLRRHQPDKYFAYDPEPDDVEATATLLGATPNVCEDKVCVFQTATICEGTSREAAARFGGQYDAALLFHTLYWMSDPLSELACLKRLLRPGAALLVGQQVVESTPGLLAMVVSFGAKRIFKWKEVESLLEAAGFELEKRFVKYTPYYIAIWRSP